MNETINLPRLIALVAERADIQPAEARKFLHELFAAVEAALIEGESVKIKGVGEFVRVEDASSPVLFKADDELAAVANEPFSAFVAVELNEGAAEEIMKVDAAGHAVSVPKPEAFSDPEPVVDAAPEPTPEVTANPTPEEVVPDKVSSESETIPEISDPEPVVPEKDESGKVDETEDSGHGDIEPAAEEKQPESSIIEESEEKIVYVQQPSNHSMWLVLGVFIGLIVGLVGGYFAGKYMAQFELPADDESVFDEDTIPLVSAFVSPVDTVAKPDTLKTSTDLQATHTREQASAPVPAKVEPVYDTVSSKRYLAIIAGEHYGVKNYWIFIYNANPNLGDPNKIAPGTKVLVPAKESFMESTKSETDAKARRLLNELSKKYKL